MEIVRMICAFAALLGCCATGSCILRCEEPDSTSGRISFQIVDRATGLNILDFQSMKYDIDTVKVFNEDWTENNGSVDLSGTVNISYFSHSDIWVPNQLVSRLYFLYFNFQDIDTIAIEYRMRDNCGSPLDSYFKVAYNDSIYFDRPVETDPPSQQFLK
jgi:hypothetical protein